MISTSQRFKTNAQVALLDTGLQQALQKARGGFIDKRHKAIDALPEFEQLRAAAIEIKKHTLAHLADYLEYFENRVTQSGGHVHWARSAEEANRIVIELCRQANAKRVTKGKTMVGEETGLNDALEAAGLEAIETDLGEYIIQLAHEPPSHIIAPAVHKSRRQIADLFREHHQSYGFKSALETVPEIVDEARKVLREKFITADVGITGANMLIAETGSTMIVTNEGNGDLTATLPRMHIVISSIEKVVPTLDDASVLLRLLPRSATGQDITSYMTFFTGPRRAPDKDGPDAFHVVLLDNGRSQMLGNEFREMLHCIRCGACLNHCPVYSSLGGHAYGWVYPGPMGSVLTPLMIGLQNAYDLPNASSLCGRCEDVCPLSIPLPKLLRQHRVQAHERKLGSRTSRLALAAWGYLARRPRLYHWITNHVVRLLARAGRTRGRFRSLPLAGAWTHGRDFPAPQGASFMHQYKRQKHEQS
jgi:L-lactate dehydrogenase complex protein LldF